MTRSILETLKSGDIETPGVFSTIVVSTRNRDLVSDQVKRVSTELDVPPKDIAVFENKNSF